MFPVDEPLASRQRKIRQFLKQAEPGIAVLLSAADCERTVRRAILALGVSPTLELAYQLGRPRPISRQLVQGKVIRYGSTITGYAKAWDVELKRFGRSLFDDVGGRRDEIITAFQLRHDLVHGDKGTTGSAYAQIQVERLLTLTSAVSTFCLEQQVNLEHPLRRRLVARKTF